MDILDVIRQGSESVEELDDYRGLREAAERFLDALGAFDGFGVVAASPQAERVLGAAMMLRPELSGSRTGQTVIFDVNIASGTLISRAAQRLRDAGNHDRLVGIALNSLADPTTSWRLPGLSEVVVTRSLPVEPSLLWEESEGSEDRVSVAC